MFDIYAPIQDPALGSKPLIQLVQECSTNVPANNLLAIIAVESKGYPWVFYNNTTRQSVRKADFSSGVGYLREAMRRGHNVDVGIAQINSKNLIRFKVKPELALIPCNNIRLSSYIFSQNYAATEGKFRTVRERLIASVKAYNTGSFYSNNGYAEKVYGSLNNLYRVYGNRLAGLRQGGLALN